MFKHKDFWAAAVVFLASAVFRLTNLDLMEFKADQILTILQLKEFFLRPYFLAFGLISSAGFHNFPLFNYLLLPFGWLSLDPQFLTFVIALVNCLSLAALYLVLRQHFSLLPSFLAVMLIASSPWAILYSRSIWAQNLLLPFLILWIYYLLARNFWGLGLAGVLLIQIHGSGMFLFAATFLAFLITKEKINWKLLGRGALIGTIPAVPYFLWQWSTGCQDCQAFSIYEKTVKIFDGQNFWRPFQIISGQFFNFKTGINMDSWLTVVPLLSFGLIIPVIFKPQTRFLAVTYVLIPLFYFFSKTPSYMHYFIIILPFWAVFLALAGNLFSKNKLLSFVFVLIISAGIISNWLFTFNFFRFAAEQKNLKGDYGSIYELTKDRWLNSL